MQLTDYQHKSITRLNQTIVEGKWSNEALVQLIELAGSYLNIKPIADYAAFNGMSYTGAKKNTSTRFNITLFNTKYIIDNE